MNDKWGRRLFVAGAIMLLLLGVAHSLSLLETPPVPANDTEKQLLDLISSYKFDLVGSIRTMKDLLRGFSISFMVGAFAVGVMDLSLRRESARVLKRAALVNVIWLAALTTVSLKYFFAVPTAFLAAALAIFAVAWVRISGPA
jgi:hypothetical protein